MSDFETALSEFRFDDAAAAIAALDDDARSEAEARLAAAREAAHDQAEDLAGRIQELAREDHYPALLAIAADPTTDRLLALVSEEIRRGAMVHLEGAARRQDLARKAARRHLDEADQALDEYDPTEARRQLEKIDERFLDEDMAAELAIQRDRLVKVTEETRELTHVTAEILSQHQPQDAGRRKGCLSAMITSLGALAGLVATGVLVR